MIFKIIMTKLGVFFLIGSLLVIKTYTVFLHFIKIFINLYLFPRFVYLKFFKGKYDINLELRTVYINKHNPFITYIVFFLFILPYSEELYRYKKMFFRGEKLKLNISVVWNIFKNFIFSYFLGISERFIYFFAHSLSIYNGWYFYKDRIFVDEIYRCIGTIFAKKVLFVVYVNNLDEDKDVNDKIK